MAWTKVKDGLFLGDFESVQDYDLIDPNSVTYFLNCAAGENDFFWEGVEFLTFHWEDSPDYTCFDEEGIVVEQIINFVDEGLRKGQSVLMYSRRGLSRSVGCCMAYLMAKYGWGCDKAFEFLEAKRVPMDLNPGLMASLYALDWRLQKSRLAKAITLPVSELERRLFLERNRAKLLTWAAVVPETTVVKVTDDPPPSEDLSADEPILVNSFVNGRSKFTYSSAHLPPPASGADGKRHAPTALRWIDEPKQKREIEGNETGNQKGRRNGHVEWIDDDHFLATSKPILDVNEAIIWVDDDGIVSPDTARSV
mmetsp:Transcript_68194/g.137185  ORF Transcript_68194/g.137185 Transcript_68194/m.137185 type:complete len:309 (+) Transcript_68194:58-984(+)